MRFISRLTALGLVLLLALVSPTVLAAVSFEFSATAKAAFDKMKGAADKATAAKLASQYAELQTIQKQSADWDTRIDNLHYRNEEAILATRKRIKEVDAEKLRRLEAAVIQAKQKYEPLFNLYDSLNQQLSIAKSFKDKTLTGLLKPQVEMAKAAVQLAKLDIRSKEAVLKTAKASTTKTIKKLRDLLSDIDPVKVKIKASKSSISRTKQQFTTEASILNQVVRKRDSTATLSSFTRMLAYMKQINDLKQNIYAYEQQTMSIIAKVDTQLAVK
ncbi:hypothetical protein [Paenibacillus sp. Soil522]|uniref:hypothetical protein n=1 Tax=Paenibacillus sp. Soil522 TaxID=1736388 RepID=UPI0006FD26F6|nr:hypothetical protein [Paenibacillus sp. Soil522]KRE47822.1 hypothetical protein ASG81_07840 [Paenibacillus sp. Soil522]